jgi:hypothetical protein
MKRKTASFKDKKGIVWMAVIPNDENIKLGNRFDGDNSPLGKAIGEVEVIKIEEFEYCDVSGE